MTITPQRTKNYIFRQEKENIYKDTYRKQPITRNTNNKFDRKKENNRSRQERHQNKPIPPNKRKHRR